MLAADDFPQPIPPVMPRIILYVFAVGFELACKMRKFLIA